MEDYLTIVFVNGTSITRKPGDLFPLSNFLNNFLHVMPSEKQTLINWDNVAYVRKAEDFEVGGNAECL